LCYVGEIGRCFETRKKEHIRNVKTCANGSNIVNHAWSFNYRIDFGNSSIIEKAPFALEKLWKLGTPLWPSMLTIILSWFQSSLVFFLNNSHLIYTFLLCFCPFYYFYLAFSCIYFIILHSIFDLLKAVEQQLKAHVLFWKFLDSECFYCNFDYVSSWLCFDLQPLN